MTPLALLNAAGLACRRGDRLLWRGVDLDVSAGDATHIIGANGVGKSSLLRVLAGLLPIPAGVVERHARIALIDETVPLDPHLAVGRALRFWATIDGYDHSSIAPALERLHIAHLAAVPVRILSTGQRKRAGLARMLLADTPLWLLDEPANGLDNDGVILLEQLIAAHRTQGGGVIVASHQPLTIGGVQRLNLGDYRP